MDGERQTQVMKLGYDKPWDCTSWYKIPKGKSGYQLKSFFVIMRCSDEPRQARLLEVILLSFFVINVLENQQ